MNWQIVLHSLALLALSRSQSTKLEVSNECFAVYLKDANNVTSCYAANYNECLELGKSRRRAIALEKQSQREEVSADAVTICERLQSCEALDKNVDFFKCNAENALRSINNLIYINLNSTAALVELNAGYSEAQKEVLLCIIEAQGVYSQETEAALDELLMCLED